MIGSLPMMAKINIDHESFSFLDKYRDKDYFPMFISHVIKSLIDQENWKLLTLLFEENNLFIHNHRTVEYLQAFILALSIFQKQSSEKCFS